MPMPAHCIDCDKVAVVLNDSVPYCPSCWTKDERKRKKGFRGS